MYGTIEVAPCYKADEINILRDVLSPLIGANSGVFCLAGISPFAPIFPKIGTILLWHGFSNAGSRTMLRAPSISRLFEEKM
jgi:hypothetical protein